MNPGNETPESTGAFSPAEESGLPISVCEASDLPNEATPGTDTAKDGVQPYDFRNPSMLSPSAMRKLRKHQDQFVDGLASRLSVHLRAEFTLKLARIQTVTFQTMAQSWADPSHLTLFKLEPLRGVAILELSPQLGSSMVDRLMGGPGEAPETFQEMSDIEKALLDQTVQILLEEWCGHWARLKEFKPVLLGYESNGRFIQTAPPETTMLLLSLDAALANCSGRIQIGFPYAALEPFIQQLTQDANIASAKAPAPAPVAPVVNQWNTRFDDLCLPVTAEWNTLEITAGEVLNLKVGDVIKMTPAQVEQMAVRIGDLPKFNGRPGTIAGQWAVELTRNIVRPPQ